MTKFMLQVQQRHLIKPIFCVLLFGFLCFFFLPSCRLVKNSYYFKDIKRDTSLNHFINGNIELKILKGDELSILVSSLNKEEDGIYNSSSNIVGTKDISGSGAASTSPQLSGGTYPVDSAGNIRIHKLGILNVQGLTLKEVKLKLEDGLSPYLRDPIISIGFSNHRVTILGSVASPQIISIPQSKLTLLDALTKCGDAPLDAAKQNILIIRDSANIKKFTHVNLENESIFNSSYYYLQPNDIVYVSPNIKKIETLERRSNDQQMLAIGVSFVSILIVILDRFTR